MPAAASSQFPAWDRDQLPEPPAPASQTGGGRRRLAALIGPGLLMVGANIGGGEWLFGPLVTAQFGGRVLWLATVAILVQVAYNLSVMRYTLYTGETIFVGFFRTWPGPRFWTGFYLLFEIGSVWPYLSSNAAVPLAAVLLGRLPGAADGALVRSLSYGIFLVAFIPLIFGGKIYNALERVMVTKLAIILSYLLFVAVVFVSPATWWEIGSGFFRFGAVPEGQFNWATLAAFSAVAGAGGLTNSAFSNYARDKGWGMGARAGAIPSAIGGRTIKLSHTGKVFDVDGSTLPRWRRWLGVIERDQLLLWLPGCILGMALPAMFSYEFIRGVTNVDGNSAAAMSAQAIASRHGQIFWFLTLLCGFLIMAPTQVSQLDNIARRWTDVLWIGSARLKHVDGHKVKYVYYSILAVYAIWGLIALRITPNPLVLAIATGVMWNFALGFSALHTLWVMRTLLPAPLRPGLLQYAGLLACAVFYIGISSIAFAQQWP
ncbi:MAG: Nramp family divalent metal transporter, partial [Bryobacterales bacterium]|nr:Nramp family divalent metal transporter [Bryobacterales bacterium]